MKTKTMTRLAILAAAALILGYIDSLIPLFPSVPGIRLGLANLVLLYAVFYLSPWETILQIGRASCRERVLLSV